MTIAGPEESNVLSSELPEARVKEVIEAVGQTLSRRDGGLSLKAIDPDGDTLQVALEKAVKDALAISPLKALVKAWQGLDKVVELTGPEGPEDDKPRRVVIANHSLKVSFTPNIVIELGKVAELRKLPIPVTFTIKVEGLIITIANRKIVEIAAGRAKPTVTVKVEDVTIFKEALPAIDLPLAMKPEAEAPDAA